MTEEAIKEFKGEHAFLSNFFPCYVHLKLAGELYTTVEHAFQAAKTLDAHQRYLIRTSATPVAAKRRGRGVELRPGWEGMKRFVMACLVRQKFEAPELRRRLLDTGLVPLEEGNTWNDTYWGVDLATGEGENHLGRILMRVRDEIILREVRL